MLEEINALPGPQNQAPLIERNRKLGKSKSGADMRRHIIGAFHRVPVQAVVFRYQAVEEGVEVVNHVRVGIFLNSERCRGMLRENSEQARVQLPCVNPFHDRAGDFIEALAVRRDLHSMRELP